MAGDYYLQRWEDGKTYYIEQAGQENTQGGGVLGGTVEMIGWNDHYIVARRISNFRGDPDGWLVIDVKARTTKGPFDADALAQLPEANGMKFLEPSAAWSKLQ